MAVGPGKGQWKADGWWGDDLPYHYPVFILTHHPRDPVEMEGGTTYHFVTDGIESALEQAGGRRRQGRHALGRRPTSLSSTWQQDC